MAGTMTTEARVTGLPGLKGKNVLVTGGSSGIGQAIAVAATMNGSDVACRIPAIAVCAPSSTRR